MAQVRPRVSSCVTTELDEYSFSSALLPYTIGYSLQDSLPNCRDSRHEIGPSKSRTPALIPWSTPSTSPAWLSHRSSKTSHPTSSMSSSSQRSVLFSLATIWYICLAISQDRSQADLFRPNSMHHKQSSSARKRKSVPTPPSLYHNVSP